MECKDDNLLEAAKALILLKNTAPPFFNRLKRHRHSPEVTRTQNVLVLPPWGLRQRRSRYSRISKRDQKWGPPSLAVTLTCSAHLSPDTPLYFRRGSDPSTSGSDGLCEIPHSKRFCGAENYASEKKFSVVERAPIKRQGRKKTLSELQTEESLLLEEKKRLLKLLEIEVIGRDNMLAENRKLLSELASSQRTSPQAEENSAKRKFLLPDLNKPMSDCLLSNCQNN